MKKLSKSGYKRNSPDKHEKSLIIPSSEITMKGVDFPVLGVDNLGYAQMMYPGQDYSFPGSYVVETPAKSGWLDKYQQAGEFLGPRVEYLQSQNTEPVPVVSEAAGIIQRNRAHLAEIEKKYGPADTPAPITKSKTKQPVKASIYDPDYDKTLRVDTTIHPESTSSTSVTQPADTFQKALEQGITEKPKDVNPVPVKRDNFREEILNYKSPLELEAEEELKVAETYFMNYDPSNKDDVKAIQRDLIKQGYLDDTKKNGKYIEEDGRFGPKTKKAYEDALNAKYNIDYAATIDLSSELEKCRHSADGCANYVSTVQNRYAPEIWKDAWQYEAELRRLGGKTKYNIYKEPEFKDVKTTSQMLAATKKVKSRSKTTADMFMVGDVVGLYYPESPNHTKAFTKGKGTYNTHIGVVTAIKDGQPVISHNIHGKVHHDAFNTLNIAWVNTPKKLKTDKVYVPTNTPESLEKKIEQYAVDLTKIFAPDVDPEQVAKTVYGLFDLETDLGNQRTDTGLTGLGRSAGRTLLWKSNEDADISRGIGKIKTATIPDYVKSFLQIPDKGDLDDDASVKAAIYKYLEAQKYFRKYSKKHPELALRQEDIDNLSILAYNQGYGKLKNLGYNNPTMTPVQEVEALRSLYSGRVKDPSSTNYRYIPKDWGPLPEVISSSFFGQALLGLDPNATSLQEQLYNREYPEGHETYISRVNRYSENYDPSQNYSIKQKKKGGWIDRYQDGGPTKQSTGPKNKFNLQYLPIDRDRSFYIDDDGNKRSEYKITVSNDLGEFVIPTVINGKQYSNEEAYRHFLDTGEHMGGPYNTPDESERSSKLRTFIYNNVPRQMQDGGDYEIKPYNAYKKSFVSESTSVPGMPKLIESSQYHVPKIAKEEERVQRRMQVTGAKSPQEVYAQEKRDKELAQIAANQASTITAGEERGFSDYIKHGWNIASNPLTAASYAIQGKTLPYNFDLGERNPLDTAVDVINPTSWVNTAGRFSAAVIDPQTYVNIAKTGRGAISGFFDEKISDEDKAAMLSTAGVVSDIPSLAGLASLSKYAYKINPNAKGSLFKPWGKDMSYRVVNQEGYDDAIKNFLVRPNPKGDNSIFSRPTNFPSFAKGKPAKNFLKTDDTPHYIMETDVPLYARGDVNPVTGVPIKSSHGAARPIDPITGKTLSSMPIEYINNIYKAQPHWLKGYERVWLSPENITDLSKLNIGKNIAKDGAFNRGVFELPDYPGYLLKYEPTNEVKEVAISNIDNLNFADLQANVNSPNFGKVIKHFKRTPHHLPSEKYFGNMEAYIMRRMQGESLRNKKLSDLGNIPESAWLQYAKDYETLVQNKLGIDGAGANVLYDDASKSFKFIDLSPADPNDIKPSWKEYVLDDITPDMNPDDLRKSIRKSIVDQVDLLGHKNIDRFLSDLKKQNASIEAAEPKVKKLEMQALRQKEAIDRYLRNSGYKKGGSAQEDLKNYEYIKYGGTFAKKANTGGEKSSWVNKYKQQ